MRLNLTSATMTKMLQRMSRAGWIEREADDENQWMMRVFLTMVGRAIHGEMEASKTKLDEEALLGFTVEVRLLFRRFLQHARDNLR